MKINLQGKKYLVTSGCSFTDGFAMGERGSWAYYLSNLLNLELHNKARGGSGNEYITNSIITYLINNKNIINECVVGVAWSDISRLMSSIFDENYNLLDTVQPQDFIEGGKYFNKKDASIFYSDIPFCIYKTYISILNLNSFLDYHNIPYFYIDAINPTKIGINNKDANFIKLYAHPGNVMELDLTNWPHQYMYVLNNTFNDLLFNNFLKIDKYNSILEFMFSDYDKYEKGNPGHPNDIASIEISKIIYNQIV